MTHQNFIKLGAMTCLLILFSSIELFVPGFYHTLITLLHDRDIQGITAYIASFGYKAMAITVLIIIITNMTGLPSIEVLTVSGHIFGLVPGIILCWIGETLGTVIAFWVIRLLFRNKAMEFIKKNKTFEKLDSYSNFKEMLIARLIPFAPNVLITTLGALSHLSFRDHFWATIIGKLPSVALEVWIGYDLINIASGDGRGILALVLTAAILFAFYIYKRKKA